MALYFPNARVAYARSILKHLRSCFVEPERNNGGRIPAALFHCGSGCADRVGRLCRRQNVAQGVDSVRIARLWAVEPYHGDRFAPTSQRSPSITPRRESCVLPVSSAKGTDTPSPDLQRQSKRKRRALTNSHLYDDAYIPQHATHHTLSGILALHGGSLPVYPASHCAS